MSEPEASKLINCKECGTDFVLTVGEQRFFKENNFSEPKRCKDCRRARREQRDTRGENFARR